MYFPLPGFVMEILDTSTTKGDRGIKLVNYAFKGVKEWWIIDSDKKNGEKYHLDVGVFLC